MKIVLLFCCCLLATQPITAQEEVPYNKVEYGILMQANYGYVHVEQTDWENLGISDEINSLETQNRMGFGLGIMAKFNLTKLISIVPQSMLFFQNNQLAFYLENLEDHSENIEPVTLAFPLHFVFTKRKWAKWNPSVLLGGRYIFDLSDGGTASRLALKQHDFAIDLGTGVEIKFDRFKMKPELLVSLGMVDLKKDQADVLNAAIASVHQDQIAFRISFYN